MKRILVICSGNTCRSPMAAGLILARLEGGNLSHQVSVASAGVRANDGERATIHGVELLAERAISLQSHRSRRLDRDELIQADLVLVMTEMHRHDLQEIAPDQMHKVLLFSELLPATEGENQAALFDIADPHGQSKEVYLATLLQLEKIVDQGWATLLARINV